MSPTQPFPRTVVIETPHFLRSNPSLLRPNVSTTLFSESIRIPLTTSTPSGTRLLQSRNIFSQWSTRSFPKNRDNPSISLSVSQLLIDGFQCIENSPYRRPIKTTPGWGLCTNSVYYVVGTVSPCPIPEGSLSLDSFYLHGDLKTF